MGIVALLFFGEKDSILVEEISKLHNLDKATVEKHYKKMLEDIKNESENQD